jgi:predicted O-methyltransferase YrrM
MNSLPADFESSAESLRLTAEGIEGFLSPNEMRFLALLAACPRAEGEVLEIGSFKGRSTFILASAAKLAGQEVIHAVDPLIAPSDTDPDLKGDESSEADFRRNLKENGVEENVEFHKEFSHELAKGWEKPIRFLWIDGDHTYEGTKADLDGFLPHLADGAIVAIHDVLLEFEGGIRVFAEDILLSRHFGACGFVGSIAWAQYHRDPGSAERFKDEKIALYKKAARLIPFVALGNKLEGLEKKKYKVVRSLVPHGAVDPEEWLQQTALRK